MGGLRDVLAGIFAGIGGDPGFIPRLRMQQAQEARETEEARLRNAMLQMQTENAEKAKKMGERRASSFFTNETAPGYEPETGNLASEPTGRKIPRSDLSVEEFNVMDKIRQTMEKSGPEFKGASWGTFDPTTGKPVYERPQKPTKTRQVPIRHKETGKPGWVEEGADIPDGWDFDKNKPARNWKPVQDENGEWVWMLEPEVPEKSDISCNCTSRHSYIATDRNAPRTDTATADWTYWYAYAIDAGAIRRENATSTRRI